MSLDGLSSRTFVVTGGASGIGAAVARRLSREGANVIVADIDEAAVENVAHELGGTARAVHADVSSEDGVRAYVGEALEHFGQLDGIHLNAGITGTPGPIVGVDPQEFARILAVNTWGVFLGLQASIRAMLDHGGKGSIVVTASTAGITPAQYLTPYSAAKAAAIGLARGAALDHARAGIRVNAICPGTVNTPMLQEAARTRGGGDLELARRSLEALVPLGRWAMPEELAAMACWLLSAESSYVTGAVLPVDGGVTTGRFATIEDS